MLNTTKPYFHEPCVTAKLLMCVHRWACTPCQLSNPCIGVCTPFHDSQAVPRGGLRRRSATKGGAEACAAVPMHPITADESSLASCCGRRQRHGLSGIASAPFLGQRGAQRYAPSTLHDVSRPPGKITQADLGPHFTVPDLRWSLSHRRNPHLDVVHETWRPQLHARVTSRTQPGGNLLAHGRGHHGLHGLDLLPCPMGSLPRPETLCSRSTCSDLTSL